MDDFSVYGDSFEDCLTNLGKVLGHIISSESVEVDKVKVDLIENLPLLTCMKEVRSFLGHVGFY